VLDTKFPVSLSNQYAASAIRPTGKIALRSLNEIPIARLSPFAAILISSPTVETSIRCGDEACLSGAPNVCRLGSETLVTSLLVARSHQSFPTIPDNAGLAPLKIVECPTAVTVGVCS